MRSFSVAVLVVGLLVGVVLVGRAASASPTTNASDVDVEDRAWRMLARMFVPAHPTLFSPLRNGQYGGINCAACTIVVTLLEQYVAIHDTPVLEVVEKVCSIFPAPLQEPCDALVEKYGPAVIDGIEKKENPDTICGQVKVCTSGGLCALHAPVGSVKRELYWRNHVDKQRLEVRHAQAMQQEQDEMKSSSSALLRETFEDEAVSVDGEKQTPWGWLYEQLYNTFNNHEPLVDLDGDKFSVVETFRGTSWRGKDCNDFEKSIHPGRKENSFGASKDHDCNGIFGNDPFGASFEDKFCGGTDRLGTMVFGDSAAAHFHIPPEWMHAASLTPQIFEHALFVLENEFDWPQLSAYTGYWNKSYGLEEGPMKSTYSYILERNKCNHRDYQSLAVNGARAGAMASDIVNTVSRDPVTDHPALAVFALVGNDVCHPGHSLSEFTPVAEFEASVLKSLNYLDTVLPTGSHVAFVGLADGTILYDVMHTLTHPLGMTYPDLYQYLNCLEISPCWGWLNLNETIRNATSAWANKLNQVYTDIINKYTFKSFDMQYYAFSELLNDGIREWTSEGGKLSDLIEPVDGFHPSQRGLFYISKYLWSHLEHDKPSWIPRVNPHNKDIEAVFGDQGGY